MPEPMTDERLAEVRGMFARSEAAFGKITGYVESPDGILRLRVFGVDDIRALDERLRRAEALIAEMEAHEIAEAKAADNPDV